MTESRAKTLRGWAQIVLPLLIMGAATAGALYVHSAAAAAVRPVEEKVAAVTTDVTTLKAQRDDDRDRLRRIETKLDAIGTAVGAHGP